MRKDKTVFIASVGLLNLQITARSWKTVDEAVDVHIRLVQLKQQVISDILVGVEFKEAMKKGLEGVTPELLEAGVSFRNLSFRICCHWLEGPAREFYTHEVDLALDHWEKLVRPRLQDRAIRDKAAREDKTAREVRAAVDKAAEEVHRHRLWLLDRVERALRKTQRRGMTAQRQGLKRKWGVDQLPEGIQLATFKSDEDCACATLQLSDGTVRLGPFRATIAEAEADLAELTALQRSAGDVAACRELGDRDARVMTAVFAGDLAFGADARRQRGGM